MFLKESNTVKFRQKKKTWTYYFSSTYSEVSPITYVTYTSKSPRHRREHPGIYSCDILKFWRFQNTRF